MSKRIALGIEYDGTSFKGWQAQPNLYTVQGVVQQALSTVANENIFLFCAGRTDAGVHATGQVVHFDTHAKRHDDAWIWGTNSNLPPGVVVRWSRHVDYSFHARFKAYARRYQYVIYNHPIKPAILSNKVSWYYYPLDVDAMREAGVCLLGEQDFSSFRSSQCNSRTPMRNVIDFQIDRYNDYIVIEIEANAFLHHMVRNIVGSLLKVGSGLKPVEWMQSVLLAKDRKVAAETAPAAGLYLIQVRYPEPYVFPIPDKIFLLS